MINFALIKEESMRENTLTSSAFTYKGAGMKDCTLIPLFTKRGEKKDIL